MDEETGFHRLMSRWHHVRVNYREVISLLTGATFLHPLEHPVRLMKYLRVVQTLVTHRSCLLNMFYSAPQGIRASFPIPSASWSSPSMNCACWSMTDFYLSVWMWSLRVNGSFTLRGRKWAEAPKIRPWRLLSFTRAFFPLRCESWHVGKLFFIGVI